MKSNYSCPISTKIVSHILFKISYFKLHENPPTGSRGGLWEGPGRQTDEQKLCNHVASSRFSLGELFRKPMAVARVPPCCIPVAMERDSSSPSTQNTASVYYRQQFYSLRLYITSFEETNLTCQRRRGTRVQLRLSPYRAVNTLRLGYKNQSVNVV